MAPRARSPEPEPPETLDPQIQNVQALAELHARAEREAGRHQRFIETMTARLGRPVVLYFLLAGVIAWALLNTVGPYYGFPQIDGPPYPWLAGTLSLLSLLMTTVVLITQNRLGKVAARRAILDLHVNLLAEQKVTKIIALIEELRRDMPQVSNRRDIQAEIMARPLDPGAAADTLEEHLAEAVIAETAAEQQAEHTEDAGPTPGR